MENADDIVFLTDHNGFLPSSTRQRSCYGYKEEDVIGKRLTIFIRPDRRDEAVEFCRQFMQRIKNTYSEYPMMQRTAMSSGSGRIPN